MINDLLFGSLIDSSGIKVLACASRQLTTGKTNDVMRAVNSVINSHRPPHCSLPEGIVLNSLCFFLDILTS